MIIPVHLVMLISMGLSVILLYETKLLSHNQGHTDTDIYE